MRLTFFLLLLISNFIHAQEHYLVINPDGHKSIVYDIDVDNNGNLVTGSFDKSVKVWDTKRGAIQREFLGQIGPGSEGMVYTLDVSPDNKYIAISGWMGKDDESEDLGDIRIYDYKTGFLKKRLKFHADVVKCVKFSDDSKYLLSGDASGFLVRWDYLIGAPTLFDRVSFGFSNLDTHTDYFISTHEDGMIYKWDYFKSKPIKKLDFFTKLKDLLITPKVAISEDGMRIAVSGKEVGMALVLDDKLSAKDYFFTGENEIIDLAFSPSGNRLILAIKDPGKNHALVYELRGKKWGEYASYANHNDLVSCVQFIDEKTCISSGGTKNELAIWQIGQEGKVKEKMILSGTGTAIYSASINENELAFSRDPKKAYGFAPYTELFDIFSRQLVFDASDFSKYSFPVIKKDNWSMYEKAKVRVKELDPSEILYLLKDAKIVDSVLRYPWQGSRHDTYSFIGDNYFVSGGSYGILEAYNYSAQLKSRFVGHEGDIRSITTSANGKFMVTSATDMTVRIWPINEIGLGKKGSLPSIWDYCKTQGYDVKYYPIFTRLNLAEKAKETSTDAWQEVMEKLIKNNYSVDFLKIKFDDETVNMIYPIASLFIADNNEWVIWNNEGYFTSSKKGARYVGYHVNQGKNNAAKFYSFDQFDLKYNRPDIILKDLEMADAGTIDLYERAYQKRLKRMGLTETDLSTDIHAPTLQILKYQQTESSLQVDIKATDENHSLNRINVFVNDVPVYGRRGIELKDKTLNTYKTSLQIDLMNGENKIQISVLNNKGVESFRETIFLTNSSVVTSDLFLVSIGVSAYQDSKFNLSYAAKDAEDLITAFDDNKVYETIHQKVMINDQVTRESVLELKEFLMSAKTNDVVMFFVAGHGVLDKNLNYYYCTYDVDFQNPERRGISYSELEALFDGIKAIRKLLIMDTCHSGELDKDEVEEIAVDSSDNSDIVFRSNASTTAIRERNGLKKTNEAVKEMFNDLNRGTGTTVISSAGGAEYAMESVEWKNGLFTYCFLNGLKSGIADLNKDGRIYISELQTYIRFAVNELSKGKQLPGSRFENISLDYAIW